MNEHDQNAGVRLTAEDVDDLSFAVRSSLEDGDDVNAVACQMAEEFGFTHIDLYNPTHMRRLAIAALRIARLASTPAPDVTGDAMVEAWQPIETAPSLDRLMVCGWQRSQGSTVGYWWYGEDATDDNGKPFDSPNALYWTPIALPPFPAPPVQG